MGVPFFIGYTWLYLPNGYVNWILEYWRSHIMGWSPPRVPLNARFATRAKQFLFDVWLTAWGVHIGFRFNMLKPYLGWLVEISILFGNGVPSKRGLLEHVENYVYFHDSQWFITTHLVGGLEHFFIFPYIGNNNPIWHSYFSEGVETTNQSMIHH